MQAEEKKQPQFLTLTIDFYNIRMTDMMAESEFLAGITEALELEDNAYIDDNFRDYEEWDSMMFLSLVSYLRDTCGLELTPETFESVDTWKDIYNKLPQ